MPTRKQELKWFDEQGPLSTRLITYIRENHQKYDVFIVVTYLYYPAVKSLPIVGEKTIFIPTAHQEPYIHMPIFKELFQLPKAFVFLTEEEQALVYNLFSVKEKPCTVQGVGVKIPENISPEAFKIKHNVDNYLVYVGRIEEGKGCKALFDYFISYKARNACDTKLVLMGKAAMPIPDHPDILSLGFVSEQEKFNGIAGAKALIMPSAFESLSMAVLEAMALSVPVIVNAKCDVLRGHCVKSNAGLYYDTDLEFEGILNYLRWHDNEYQIMKKNAKAYIEKYYQWDHIMEEFCKLIETIA